MEHTAIRNLYPDAVSIVGNKAYDKDNKLLVLDDALVQNEIDRLQAAYDAEQWKRNRQAKYPNHEECIHALLDGGDTLTELQTKRQEVKSTYPKPIEA